MHKNKLFLLLATVVVALASCTKDSSTGGSNSNGNNGNNGGGGASNQLAYAVSGLTDQGITQYKDTTFYMALGFNYVSGTQEAITVTTTAPANCTISPSTFSGTPTFATICTLHVQAMTSGNLPVTLSSTSASGTTKTFSFNLVSAANVACADIYVDTFTYVDSMIYITGGTGTYNVYTGTAFITRSASNPNVLITPVGDVTVNCSNSAVSTASVHRTDADFDAGAGTRSSNNIDINRVIHVHDGSSFDLNDHWHFKRK